jgi:hypothetical protein
MDDCCKNLSWGPSNKAVNDHGNKVLYLPSLMMNDALSLISLLAGHEDKESLNPHPFD